MYASHVPILYPCCIPWYAITPGTITAVGAIYPVQHRVRTTLFRNIIILSTLILNKMVLIFWDRSVYCSPSSSIHCLLLLAVVYLGVILDIHSMHTCRWIWPPGVQLLCVGTGDSLVKTRLFSLWIYIYIKYMKTILVEYTGWLYRGVYVLPPLVPLDTHHTTKHWSFR